MGEFHRISANRPLQGAGGALPEVVRLGNDAGGWRRRSDFLRNTIFQLPAPLIPHALGVVEAIVFWGGAATLGARYGISIFSLNNVRDLGRTTTFTDF